MNVYVYQYTHTLAKPVFFHFQEGLVVGYRLYVILNWYFSPGGDLVLWGYIKLCLDVCRLCKDRKICSNIFKIHLHWFKCNLLCTCLLPYFRFANLHKTQLPASTQRFLVLHHPLSWAWFPCTLRQRGTNRILAKAPQTGPHGVGRGANDGLVPIFKDPTPICDCIKAAKKLSNWGKI